MADDDDRPLPANAFHKHLEATGQRGRVEAETVAWLASQGMDGAEARWGGVPGPGERPFDLVLVGRLGPRTAGYMLEKGSELRPCSMCGETCVVSQNGMKAAARGTGLICRECIPRLVQRS